MMCSGRTSMLTLTLRFVVNRMLQSYKLLVSFPRVSLVCHTEFLLRHESRLIRLGLDTPSFPIFSVDESHYYCPLCGNEEQTYFHSIFEIAPTNGQQAALA